MADGLNGTTFRCELEVITLAKLKKEGRKCSVLNIFKHFKRIEINLLAQIIFWKKIKNVNKNNIDKQLNVDVHWSRFKKHWNI